MNNKIKLLIVTPSLACGGAERNVVQLCNHLNPEKFDTVLLVLDNSHPFYTISQPAVKLKDLDQPRASRSLFQILKTIRSEKPELILSTSNHLNLLLAIFRFLIPASAKLAFRETSIMSINSKRAKFPAIYNFLLKRFYKKADTIVCQSDYMKQDLLTQYRIPLSKLTVIPNSVEVPVISPINISENNIPHFLTVARLSEEKGIDRIIRALVHVKTDFRYTIVGYGPERSAIEKLIVDSDLSDKITLTGQSQKPFDLQPAPDLFLMGSHYEGFPNVVLEANSIGIPVVAYSAPGGILDVIRDGENGFLAEDGNIFGFADAIHQALKYSFDQKSIRQKTLENYHPTAIMHIWENLFIGLVSAPRGS